MKRSVSNSLDFDDYLKEQFKNPTFKKHYFIVARQIRIGYEVAQLRKSKKMSQGALARKLGVEKATIDQLEMGDKPLTIPMLGKIAEVFEKDLYIEFR